LVSKQSKGTISLDSNKLHSLQFLRFCAAFMVVLYHANIMIDLIIQRDQDDIFVQIINIGKIGVPIFFVISGFIMVTISWNDFQKPKSTLSFLLRITIRIFPIYWVALALYLAFRYFIRDNLDINAENVIGAALLFPGYTHFVISPAWTLTYELYFYGLFSVCLFLPRRLGITVMCLFFVSCVLAGFFLDLQGISKTLDVVVEAILLNFVSGMLLGAAFMTPSISKILARPWIARSTLFAGIAALAAVPLLRPFSIPDIILLGVPSLLLVWGAVFSEQLPTGGKFVRHLSFLGDSSYSVYLFHMLVLTKLRILGSYLYSTLHIPHVIIIVIYSIIALVFGMIMYYMIEKHLIRMFRNLVRSTIKKKT